MVRRLSRAENRAETAARLLRAAAEVFAQRGFAGATVEEIAETAGHTKGAVYYNFTDKEGLFLALLAQRVEVNLHAAASALGRHEPGPDQDAALDASIEAARDPQWGVLMTEFWLYAQRHPEAHARLADHQRRLHELVTGVFQDQCDRHGISPAVPLGDLAGLLLAADTGLAQLERTDPELTPPGLYAHLVGLLRHAAIHGWDLSPTPEGQPPIDQAERHRRSGTPPP